MPSVTLDDGLALHFRLEATADGPALLFSNSLGTDLRMWDEQAAALGDTFQIVRYDTRGHGASGVANSPATLDRLGRDLLALLNYLQLERSHVCGLSLGGLTAQWLAIHHPNRVGRLVLSNTAARIGSVESWEARIAAVETGGMEAIADAVLAHFFSPSRFSREATTPGKVRFSREAERVEDSLDALEHRKGVSACPYAEVHASKDSLGRGDGLQRFGVISGLFGDFASCMTVGRHSQSIDRLHRLARDRRRCGDRAELLQHR